MDVLFLLTQDIESPAGAGRYLPLAAALVRRGHRVQISGLHPNFRALEKRRFTTRGVEVHYVGQMHVRKVAERKLYLSRPELIKVVTSATLSLSRISLSTPTDVIHVGKAQPMNGIAAILAKRMRHVPMVLDCDDLEAANNRFTSHLQQSVVALAERLAVRTADHITTHSSVILDWMVRSGVPRSRLTYLPHGTEVGRFSEVSAEMVSELRARLQLGGQHVVLFAGSLSSVSHDLSSLVGAFSLLIQRQPETVLLLVGGGEDFDRLQQLASRLGLESHIRFCGRVSPETVPAYYQLADVAVDPVYDNAAGRASLSLKMFESWSAGVPLVTVDVGDRRSVVGDPPAAIVVQPEDPEALAQALSIVIEDADLRSALRERALTRAAAYSWDGLAERVESLYAALVPGSSDER